VIVLVIGGPVMALWNGDRYGRALAATAGSSGNIYRSKDKFDEYHLLCSACALR
jgi:hypothetical protein